ncbi:MAG: aminotransferase class IV [Actinomycetes bacterium]
MKIWLNGVLHDEDQAQVSAFDHGITVGDGVFETCAVRDGRPFALGRHLARLGRSADGLGLPAPDLDLVRGAARDTIEANEITGPMRLRITYTAGPGPLGSDRGTAQPTLLLALARMAAWPATTAVATVPWPRNERGVLAGIKTTSYADNVVALASAKARGAGEALFANTAGNLCEGTGSNVFVGLEGRLVTPPLTAGCLAGVTRSLLLEWVDVDVTDVPMSALEDAQEVFLTSATRGVQPVHAVDGHALPEAPGPLGSAAAAVFAARAAEGDDP